MKKTKRQGYSLEQLKECRDAQRGLCRIDEAAIRKAQRKLRRTYTELDKINAEILSEEKRLNIRYIVRDEL